MLDSIEYTRHLVTLAFSRFSCCPRSACRALAANAGTRTRFKKDQHPTPTSSRCTAVDVSILHWLLIVINSQDVDCFYTCRQHRGKVTGIAFNPVSSHLYSCGSVGSLALHDTSDDKYQLMRLLTNAVARGDTRCPSTLAVSSDGRRLAFVGPTDFTISVVDAKSLDEVFGLFFALIAICFLLLVCYVPNVVKDEYMRSV